VRGNRFAFPPFRPINPSDPVPTPMEPDPHTSRQFDAALDQVRSRVLLMGRLVEQQTRDAMKALISGDLDLVDHVIRTEGEVNQLEITLDELCASVIARRHPAAVDLRMLVMIFKIITDIERIGDQAKKIALIVQQLYADGRFHSLRYGQVERVAEIVLGMLRLSLEAFARFDPANTPIVVRRDMEVDEQFKLILRHLLTYMIEDPRTISESLDIIFVAKALERIGDHATNMCEYVVYMTSGQDVRHGTLEDVERALRPG